MKKLLLLLMFIPGIVFPQKEANNWYFGNLGFSFNTRDGNPKVLYDRLDKSFLYASSIISDKQGNLLFYSDGCTVWNKEHKMMINGYNLKGWTWISGIIIVPFVNDDTKYYIFTSGNFPLNDTALYYSVVDITKDSGRGEVIIKNKFVGSPFSGYLTAIRHDNKKDIWLITHEFDNENFLSFLITEQGLQNVPVKTTIGSKVNNGSKINNGSNINYQVYHFVISPRSKKLALGFNDSSKIELFDFNTSTGRFSNFTYIRYPIEYTCTHSHSFSPDGSKLYVFSHGPAFSYSLKQFDMNYSNQDELLKSEKIIFSTDYTLWAFNDYCQLAPNGKIYIYQSGNILGIINRPNETGENCMFETRRFFIGNDSHICYFPNIFPEFLVNDNYKISTNSPLCEGDSIMLFGDNVSSSKYQWTGPNGFSSIEANPVIRNAKVNMSGYYYLKTDDFTYNVYVLVESVPQVKIKVNGATSLCPGEKTILQADVSGNTDYWWSNDENSPEISVSKAGKYTLYAMNKSGCIDSNSIEIKTFVSPKPKLNLFNDTSICSNEKLILRTTQKFSSYKWTNGETNDSILITKSGVYSVSVTDSNGCSGVSNSIRVIVNPSPQPKIHGANSVCLNNELVYQLNNLSNLKTEININNGVLISNSGDSLLTVKWDRIGLGSIIVNQTDTSSGCQGYDTLNVTIFDSLKPKIKTNKTALCTNDIITITLTENYSKYKWNNGDTTKSISISKAGEYYVWVEDDGGCKGTSDKIKIIEAPAPKPTLSADTLLCPGSIVKIDLLEQFTLYTWSTGETTKEISVNKPGIYSVVVTDTNGCTGTTSVEIKQFDVKLTGLNDLDFGKIKKGTSDSKKIILKNESVSEISISKIITKFNSSIFSINTKPIVPARLKPNETIEIDVSFTPDEYKDFSDSLIVETDFPCPNKLSSCITGKSGAKTYIWLPDTTGNVGDKDFCIELKSNFSEEENQLLSFSAKVRFDASAFLPDSIYTSYILGTDRFVDLSESNISVSQNETTLGELCGTILLADNDRTPLFIDDFKWSESGMEIEKKDGSLTLTGVCARNISRIKLIVPDYLIISPNPATDFIEISYSPSIKKGLEGVSEELPVRIYNVFGQEVNLTPALSILGEGVSSSSSSSSHYSIPTTKYSTKIDVSGLPAGVYFVKLGDKVIKFIKI